MSNEQYVWVLETRDTTRPLKPYRVRVTTGAAEETHLQLAARTAPVRRFATEDEAFVAYIEAVRDYATKILNEAIDVVRCCQDHTHAWAGRKR